MCLKLFILIGVILTSVTFAQEFREIVFGGLFSEPFENEDNSTLTDEQAFRFAVHFANTNLEPEKSGFLFKAVYETPFDHLHGPFKAKLSSCALIDQQAFVIFGPKHIEDVDIVHSLCENKEIAHVVNRWMYQATDYRSIINLYPHSGYLTSAYFSIIKLSEWKTFTLFYEDNESLLRLGDLLNMAKNEGIIVVVKQLDEVGDGVFRTTLKDAVHSGERNYVVDCSIEILGEVLRQAQQVGLMTSHYNYFITNLDLQTIDLEPFQYSEANITGIRIFDPSSDFVNTRAQMIKSQNFNPDFDVNKMKTETALLIDSVMGLAAIISKKINVEDIKIDTSGCEVVNLPRHGVSIFGDVITAKDMQGITGGIEFDSTGVRGNFNLDIIDIRENGINRIGSWNSSKGLTTIHPEVENDNEDNGVLRNKTFVIITCLTDPYCMLKESSVQLFGNERFEGFAIDLIHELAMMEGFNYTFIIREDKKNGAKDEVTKVWSGMIGDVMNDVAQFAITDLTITAEREEAVDFTSPFMNLGISILAKKPGNAPPSFFSFADPFAIDTWIMLGIAYAIVSLSFFILARLCQEEWTNPYPCIEEPEFLINQFSLQNSAWFAMGALMQQGTEIAPIAISTRMVSGMWWFFVLIMVSSYTASLAAFLATENPIHLFTDVNSLIENKDKFNIRLGAKKNGATEGFFKGKENPVYKAIAKHMENHPEDMVKENRDGVKLAEDETYAFFMESISIEYETQRHCELQQYGKLLDDKGYGIAMKKNSTYRKKLSTAILKLQSSGTIDTLKRKWWEEKRGGGQCVAGASDDQTPPLGVQNVQGVFYVTIVGTILAVLVVGFDLTLAVYRVGKKAKIPFSEALRIEMRAFMDFSSDVKPTIRSKSNSGSKSSKGTASTINNKSASAAPYGFIPAVTKDDLNE